MKTIKASHITNSETETATETQWVTGLWKTRYTGMKKVIGPPGETSRLFICTSLTRCVASMVSPDGAMDSTPD